MKSLFCPISRYLVVCNAATMVGREKKISQHIMRLTINISIGVGLASWIYKENIQIFLNCMGRMELFIFDLDNPFLPFAGGVMIKLSLLNQSSDCIRMKKFKVKTNK